MLDFHIFTVDNDKSKVTSDKKPVSEMLVDSTIVAGIVFFSTWNGTLDVNNFLNAIKGFGLAFLTQIAYYRGLKK